MDLRKDADQIIQSALQAALPDTAVKKALEHADFGDGKLVLISAGKAAWQMAKAATELLGSRITRGVVVTKYDHSRGELPGIRIFEAGHPVPDENSFLGTQAAIDAVQGLTERDTVLFLLSGGGSALFEKPLISKEELESLTRQMLACGADIVEMNTVRKRMSAVKGGRFARICAPAHVYSVVLSDIIGDPLDMIASGPAYPDSSTCEQAEKIVQKYHLELTESMKQLLQQETPKELDNVETHITGSVRELCRAAECACRELGYETVVLTSSLSCVAREAGVFLANIAQFHKGTDRKLAFIAGGETVVHLTGHGKGGRNQELALAAAPGIAGMAGTAVFSVGSDGTDGPTDAAGGYVDGTTAGVLAGKQIDIYQVLQENDAYHALEQCGGLIITGATGTNVNDISVLLIQ
ncbi:MAG: glycerate kinase [Eubacteriales bacterium]|nr:glycerate kinase [Eubacteriales bacterium]